METIYRKVIIKSTDDLPKEGQKVYSHNVNGDFEETIYYPNKIFCGDNWWLKYIDWYLLPVDLPTDEELNEYVFKLVPTCILKGHESVGDVNEDCRKSVIEALKWLCDKLLNNPLK